MEDVSDGCIEKPFFEPINQWFQHMMERELVDTTDYKDINAEAQKFEEMGVIESEISRLKSKIKEERGINQQVRLSLESYIDDEDETLPPPQNYTADFSRVNYDTSLAWIETRQEAGIEERMVQGVRAICMAVAWLAKFAIKPETAGVFSLERVCLDLIKEHRELSKNATTPPDEAIASLFTMMEQLGLDEKQIDMTFVHDTSYVMMRQQVLKKLGSAYLSPKLDALLIKLTESDCAAVEFKDYATTISDMIRQVTHSLTEGVANGEAVSAATIQFGGIDKLNELTNNYTKDMNNKGTAYPVDLEYIDTLTYTLTRYPLLIDGETDVQDKLNASYEALVKAFNLEAVQGESVIDVRQPETLLSVIDDNLTILLALIDAMRVRADIYNSLVTLLEGKIILGKAYSVYLVSLAE